MRTLYYRCKAAGGVGKPLCARQVYDGCAHDGRTGSMMCARLATYQVEMRNRKNSAGMWEQVPFYQFAPKESVGGDNHGSLSCQRIMEHGIRLTQEEYGAVNNHMGVTNSANSSGVWQCYEMYTLSWLLHVADEAATVIDKNLIPVKSHP